MFYPGFSKIRISKLYKFENVSALVDCYNSTSSGLLQEQAPVKKRVATIRPATLWYDNQIRTQKANRRRLERIWCKNKLTINREMFVKQCKCVNRLISDSRMNFYADINKDNSSNPRVLFSTFEKLLHHQNYHRTKTPSIWRTPLLSFFRIGYSLSGTTC